MIIKGGFNKRRPVVEANLFWKNTSNPIYGQTMTSDYWILALLVGTVVWIILLRKQIQERTRANRQLLIEIGERRNAEAALRESQRQLSTLLGNLQGMAFRCWNDEYWTLEFASDGCEHMTGYLPEELIQHHKRALREMIHPEDRKKVWDKVQTALKEQAPFQIEYRYFTKAGEQKWAWAQGVGVWTEDNEVIALEGFVTDITEKKFLEEKHLSLGRQLRRAQKLEAIGTLAGGIAHDFNNILFAIMSYATMASKKIPQGNRGYHHVSQIIKASERAQSLIQQILTFSRQHEHHFETIELSKLVEEPLALIRSTLPKTIEIQLKIETDQSTIAAVPSQIHQLLVNLWTNAGHAMRQTGGLLEIRLTKTWVDGGMAQRHDVKTGNYLLLIVSDTGCGMAPEVMERIFDPFFTTKPVDEGTGLGLAVVHGIVKSHQGIITVTSEEGKGTTFFIYFPVSEERFRHSVEEHYRISRGQGHILLVDDEKIIVEPIQEMLEAQGYQVTSSLTGVEALEWFQTQPDQYDLVITDQILPKLTGTQLAVKLMNIREDIPVIIMTGYQDLLSADHVKQIGVRELLIKPVTEVTLSQTIQDVLRQ